MIITADCESGAVHLVCRTPQALGALIASLQTAATARRPDEYPIVAVSVGGGNLPAEVLAASERRATEAARVYRWRGRTVREEGPTLAVVPTEIGP